MTKYKEIAKDEVPFDLACIPQHIAIIMDGNGRWAQAKKRPRLFGHQAGVETVRRVVKACGRWGVGYLTLYAFSTENWKRPEDEVGGLMKILEFFLGKEVKELNKQNVRMRVIGDLSRLPKSSQKALEKAIKSLDKNTGLTMTLALNYGGRDEIVRAAQKLATQAVAGEIAPDEITIESFAGALDTAGMPDPDLMIRTAGELRLSNYLLWQLSYAELYATPLCWPDFDDAALAEAICAYQNRTRKFGAVVE